MDVNSAAMKRNGIRDFVSLRATGLIIASYALFIIGFILTTEQMTYTVWRELFSSIFVKAFSLLALLCVSVHARIGMWQVATDYIKNAKARAVLAFSVAVLAYSYVAVGIFVLWGV